MHWLSLSNLRSPFSLLPFYLKFCPTIIRSWNKEMYYINSGQPRPLLYNSMTNTSSVNSLVKKAEHGGFERWMVGTDGINLTMIIERQNPAFKCSFSKYKSHGSYRMLKKIYDNFSLYCITSWWIIFARFVVVTSSSRSGVRGNNFFRRRMTEDAVWKKLTEQWESECLCDRQTNRREQR